MSDAPSRMPSAPAIVAILCSDSRDVDPIAAQIVEYLTSAGMKCAGFLQRDVPREGRSRCDMLLESLSTGEVVGISEDRGLHARGCRLDVRELMRAMALASAALDAGCDLLVVNKFGKTEVEGGGFRPLIAEAAERGIPVLIAVPWRNVDGWRHYVGDLAMEVSVDVLTGDGATICSRLGFGARPAQDGSSSCHS